MCYNTQYATQQSKTYSSRYEIDKLQMDVFPKMYFANGFDYPDMMVITDKDPYHIQPMAWGLIPHWAKLDSVEKIRRGTLNARDDQIFEKASFKMPIVSQRCLVILDAYYEYHTVDSKTKVPYRFTLKNDTCLTMAGIYDTWNHGDLERKTVSIVTTSANESVARIHNNPDMLKRGGSRMPLILTKETERLWLEIDATDKAGREQLIEIMGPVADEDLEYHQVKKLLGNEGSGNSEEATKPYYWPLIGLP